MDKKEMKHQKTLRKVVNVKKCGSQSPRGERLIGGFYSSRLALRKVGGPGSLEMRARQAEVS
jgi:hypothetical protein